jgi:hypothetical protein
LRMYRHRKPKLGGLAVFTRGTGISILAHRIKVSHSETIQMSTWWSMNEMLRGTRIPG